MRTACCAVATSQQSPPCAVRVCRSFTSASGIGAVDPRHADATATYGGEHDFGSSGTQGCLDLEDAADPGGVKGGKSLEELFDVVRVAHDVPFDNVGLHGDELKVLDTRDRSRYQPAAGILSTA